MYKCILVPLALDHGLSPEMLGIARALLAPGGEIHALHVFDVPSGSMGAVLDRNLLQEGQKRAADLLKEKTAGLEDVTGHLVSGHVYRSILDFAESHDVDCIVMGSHKPDLSDYLLGSTAARVVRHARCAVHVYRGDD